MRNRKEGSEVILLIYIKTDSNEKLTLKIPAFLIGNGINYNTNESLSWTQLLVKLLPKNYFENNDDGLSPLIKKVIEKLQASDTKLFNEGGVSTEDNKKIQKFIIELLRKHEDIFQRNMDGLSYPEIAELTLRINECSISVLKENVANLTISEQENFLNMKHTYLLKLASENNIPILTTNYDQSLINTRDLVFKNKNIHWIKNNRKEDKIYLTNAYLRPTPLKKSRALDVSKEFAIWYIHGIAAPKSYINSIKITNKDYANTISRLKNSLIDMKKNKGADTWKDYYSWIKILMNNDLIIAGLGLETSEMDLRWILVERYIYHLHLKQKDDNYKTPQTIYIYTKDLPNGTKIFFQKLGIKIIKKEYSEVFNFNQYIKVSKTS